MPDIFISYARVDAGLADRLAAVLRQSGFEVWIDATGIEHGKAYDRQIEAALTASRCAIVLWSANSVDSEWVRNEAGEAYRNDKLIPLLTDDAEPPLQFRSVQALDFRGWSGTSSDREFLLLKAVIDRRLGDGLRDATPAVQTPQAAPASPLGRTLETLGVGFADNAEEKRFGQFFLERHLPQTRMSLLLPAALFGVYAVVDFITAGGTSSTSSLFEFIVTPVLIGAFLLSLWPPILPFWRLAVLFYTGLGQSLIIVGLVRVMSASPDPHPGSLLSVAMLALIAFIGFLPIRVPETILLCMIPLGFQLVMGPLLGVVSIDGRVETQMGIAIAGIAIISAWWRERLARRWFVETTRVGGLR